VSASRDERGLIGATHVRSRGVTCLPLRAIGSFGLSGALPGRGKMAWQHGTQLNTLAPTARISTRQICGTRLLAG
jgi:hypothetical protein